MKRALIILLSLGLIALPASASHWTPGNGNPASHAQELGDGNLASTMFGDDWPPFTAWPFSEDDNNDPVDETPSDNETNDPCQQDIEDAQDTSEGRICTQQTQLMTCPHDPEVTYQAPDGCQISFLEDRGWTSTSDEPDDTGTEDPVDDTDTGDADSNTDTDEDEASDEPAITEEEQLTPTPEPEAVGEDWISYPNPRDHVPNPSTAGAEPSVKICAVILNQENEVITGHTVSDTEIAVGTDIPYSDADPVVFTLPLDQRQDLVGSDPAYVEGDGLLDAECAEYHNLPDSDYAYDAPTITGADADQVEFVGVTEYWDATGQGDPFHQQVFIFGENELSDGYIPTLTTGNYEQQHAEVVYLFRLR